MYEQLNEQVFSGKTLDFGGGSRSNYIKLFDFDQYHSVNIDPEIQPTKVVAEDEVIPFSNEYFDHIISLNTIEHIYNAHFVIKEMYRVLKPSGQLSLATPFMYPIHAHPDDYFRPTPSWYERSLSEAGFTDIQIIPLVWGPFSNSFLVGSHRYWAKLLYLTLDLIYMTLNRSHHSPAINYSLGFFVTAYKRASGINPFADLSF